MGNQPRQIMRRSAGSRALDQRFYGTTSRVGWTQGVTLHLLECRRAQTWLFIWSNAWRDAQSQNQQPCKRNTIGIATHSNQSSTPSRRPCLQVAILRERGYGNAEGVSALRRWRSSTTSIMLE